MRQLVVVTRVAARSPGLGDGRRIPTVEWVAGREELLRLFPAAAMAATPDIPWVWLTVPERLDQVREIADRVYPAAIVRTTRRGEVPEIPGDTFMVARLDSDDAWTPEALRLMAELDLPARHLVNFPCGWQIDPRTGQTGLLDVPEERQGPFLAITRESRDRMLDFGGSHLRARKNRTVLTVRKRAWIQTVHGGNLANEWRAFPCGS